MTEELLKFYSALGRPLSWMETARLSGLGPREAGNALQELAVGKRAKSEAGFYSLASAGLSASGRTEQDLLWDLKWRKFLRLARWFRFVPFVEFVTANGSMAIGNVSASSDFDVLVGVRTGRMFTARYILNFVLGLAGGRRLNDEKDSSPNKLCFNHFVTRATFEKAPHNLYRRELYRNLVPVWGDLAAVRDLFTANAWCGATALSGEDLRFTPRKLNLVGNVLDSILGGRMGDWMEERLLAPIAKRRLQAYVAGKPKDGRAVVSDEELEFHFDLRHERRFAGLDL